MGLVLYFIELFVIWLINIDIRIFKLVIDLDVFVGI